MYSYPIYQIYLFWNSCVHPLMITYSRSRFEGSYLFHSPHLRHVHMTTKYTLIKLKQKCQIYISDSLQSQTTYIFCNIIFFTKNSVEHRPFFYHKDVHGTYKNKVELSLTLFQQSTSDWEHQL